MEENPGYIYDTNVLIQAYKNGEKLKGYTTAVNAVEFPAVAKMRGINIIYPQPKDYKLAARIMLALLERGKPVPATDLIIAAVAINRGMILITGDKHFQRIAEVVPLSVREAKK